MNNLEHKEQCAVVQWFKLQYPALEDCIMAIPNGSHLAGTASQRARKMSRMKKEGFKNGVSDLLIAVPSGGYHGLWVEMKATGKTLSSVSKEQREHLALMERMGYRAEWCAGAEAAIQLIRDYLGDLHYSYAGGVGQITSSG